MKNRILLLSAAVIFVGMFAMPGTLSLFAGQHSFKNASEVRSDNGCRGCHEDVYEEMHNPINTVHWNIPGAKGTYDVFYCSECHNATLNISYNYLYNNAPSGTRPQAHAVQTVPCLDCHGTANLASFGSGASLNPFHRLANKYNKGPGPPGAPTWDSKTCGQCHLNAEDPGTDTFITSVNSKIEGSQEAHIAYYYASNTTTGNNTAVKLKGANTACIGCHTHTRVNFTWIRLTDYNVTADATTGSWNVTVSNDWPNSTNTTYTNKSY